MKNSENSKQREARLRRERWLAALDLFDLLVLLGPPSAMRIPVFYHEKHPN
jgi:hypothetical protein